MRIRRLKILGVAMGLSLLAALVGVVFYLLPRNVAPSANRIADFVVLNNAKFWVDDHAAAAALFRFPSRDDENEHLRFIAIDEGSLDAPPHGLGAWPWPRSRHGQLLQRLARAGAKVVTFDVLFLEPASDPAQDTAFAAGLRAQPTVLGFTIDTTRGGVFSLLGPPPSLADNARALGFTTVDNPGGWLVGQFLTMRPADGRTYPSLAAATTETYTGAAIEPIDAWHGKFGTHEVPLDGEGQITMLPFVTHEYVDQQDTSGLSSRAGAARLTIPFVQIVSYADALRMDDASLRSFVHGNVVVVGATAQALGDYIVTPNGRYPGVFANLRLMDQLMRGTFVRRVPPALDLVLIVLIPLLIGFVVTQLRAAVGVAIAVGVVVVYSITAVALYGSTLHWMNLIHVDTATILAALSVALYRTITEGADKRVIKEMFGKHVSPELVEVMLAHDDPLKALDLSGKRVKVTVFYSDIRGFTAMSEKMSPEEIYGALNEYFEEMCQIVFKYGGYVDKFIGDCLMAVFAAPNPQPDDAYHAARCAWDQQRKIDEMMVEWTAAGRQAFTVGMGLNTGEVVMGNLGSSDRLNYTVIGDNVNTAARLYNVAKGGQIIISESTYEEVKDRFIVNELTPVSVKGKTLPLRNFEIIAPLEPGEPNTSTILDPENLPEATVADAH
ncbi:MAG: adenylate/guanylate cyclase domain-containing protein [Candidatus Eremiobacteraeota bacterium]|nr:adenylate/guanylate cyclase domain-containing protein [Candidatus Eremiobacteraeota bacterium]